MSDQLLNTIPEGTQLDVLVVEPSRVFGKLLKAHLEENVLYKFKVNCVGSLADSIEILSSNVVDAVILNLNLPDCKHGEIFPKVKELIPDTAIIITTSASDQAEAMLAVKGGAQDFLYKPDITSVLLRKTVLFAIDRQKNQQIAEEREKLLLSRFVTPTRKTAPMSMKMWADRVTRALKRMNVGFPDKRNVEKLWDDFTDELRQSFVRNGLSVDDSTEKESKGRIVSGSLCECVPLDALVAEDSPINQKIATKVCEKLNLKLTFASDGIEAVQAFRDKKFRLIFMDIQMPGMDGLEATRIIRSEAAENEQPKIIALTASDLGRYGEIYEDAGMDASLNKPFKKEKVEEVLNQLFC